jgi:hypothetical protein
VDWRAERGRRAVRKNGRRNRGERCDDVWVFHIYSIKRENLNMVDALSRGNRI